MSIMTGSRVEIVREQLAKTNVEWNNATRELREVILGLAAEIQMLDQRVKRLEAERPASSQSPR
jgi:hypothetical protein